MVRMPTSMPKSPKDRGMKEAASETVDEMLTEAEQMRQRKDLGDHGRRTLDQIQEDARNLGEYARGKMEHMNEVMKETAASARESAGLPDSAPVPTDAMSNKVMDSLKTASEKLSAEINDLGERVESVRARVAQQVHAAGGKAKETVTDAKDSVYAAGDKAKETVYAAGDKAKDTVYSAGDKAKETWIQSSEAAKNVGEREYCLPLPTDRICARHVAMVGLPLLALFVLMMMRRRYPKKWQASVDKMRTPGKTLAQEMPSSDQLKSKLEGVADTLEQKIEYGKQRGGAVVDQVRSKYGQVENKKEK